MNTLANQATLAALINRLDQLSPDSTRRWGVLTPGEVLCHLGDAGDAVLQRRIPTGKAPGKPVPPVIKWLLLYSPVPWPKGVPTRPGVNPRQEGTRPADFEADRARVVDGLHALANARADQLATDHFRFGTMSLNDWHRWAYRHVDHHLRQFGV